MDQAQSRGFQIRRRVNEEIPLHKLGWYKCQSVETPMHVSKYDESQEELYKQIVKPKEKHRDWRMLMTSLKQKISYLYCNEMFSDFLIILKLQQDKHFPAHRFIIAMQSLFFQKMLYGSFSTGKEDKYFTEASEETIKNLLRYIYTGDMPDTDDFTKLSDIIHLADMYMMYPLREVCEKRAIELLDENNACEFFQTAYMLNLNNLKDTCLKYYNMNFEQFLSSPYFVSLNEGIVLTLYDMALQTNRKQIFTPYLMRWCRSELQRRGMPDHERFRLLEPFMKLHTKNADF